jgi:hypothetical protein
MLWLVIVMTLGLLGLTIAGRKDQRTVALNLGVGHEKFTERSGTSRFPHITEKERELH